MIINTVWHWPVWSSQSPWSRASQSDRPGSGRCASPGIGSYWGRSVDVAPVPTKTGLYLWGLSETECVPQSLTITITTTGLVPNLIFSLASTLLVEVKTAQNDILKYVVTFLNIPSQIKCSDFLTSKLVFTFLNVHTSQKLLHCLKVPYISSLATLPCWNRLSVSW